MELREAINAAIEEEQPNETANEVVADSTPAREADSGVESESPEKAESADAPVEKATAPAEKPVPDTKAETPEQQAVHRVDRAPASWRKEAKGEWAAVPLHIRQEVHKREMEISKALNEANASRQSASQFEQVAQPYMARIQAAGITPAVAFNELLKADYSLATGTPQSKAQMLDKLIQDYGVDIGELDSVIARRLNGNQGQQSAQQGFDPNHVNQLVQQLLQQALAPLYQQQAEQAQQTEAQAAQTVEQMSLDPQFPHFDEVRQDMADLIEINSRRGVYLSLEQAYNKATGMNPDLSASITATHQNQVAQRAKAAAASVSGAPTGMSQQHQSAGSLRDDILAAMSGGRM